MRASRARLILLPLIVYLVVVVPLVAWYFTAGIYQLDQVEKDRDRWQRPAEVLRAAGVHPGSRVADLGCGSGYFTLKLSQAAGRHGQVLAEDIRELPLIFLRLRTALLLDFNVRIIRGTPDDPHLPDGSMDAVLIVNTFHELDHPAIILALVRRALRPGGRLVVVDRGPPEGTREAEEHHIARSAVETMVVAAGFTVMARNDQLVARSGDEAWWMIVARRP